MLNEIYNSFLVIGPVLKMFPLIQHFRKGSTEYIC